MTLVLTWGSLSLADEEPPLPTWDFPLREDQKEDAGRSFSNLLPEKSDQTAESEFYLGMPGGLTSPPLLLEDSEFSSSDLSLFLHGGLLSVPTASATPKVTPTAHLALREVPEEVLAAIKTVPKNEYFNDPQGLVTELPTDDLRRLLEFHASEAEIILYLLVIDHDQKVTDMEALQKLVGDLKKDAQHEVCLALYPLGEPWRTRFWVTQRVSDSTSVAGLREMAEDCIQDALRVHEPDAQLQRFTVRLSTRLFWLEKALPVVVHQTASAQDTLVQEVGSPQNSSELSQVETPETSPMTWGGLGGMGLVVMLGLWYGKKAKSRKPAKKVVWVLPEREVPPRLGGAFSGGAGAAFHYQQSSD